MARASVGMLDAGPHHSCALPRKALIAQAFPLGTGFAILGGRHSTILCRENP